MLFNTHDPNSVYCLEIWGGGSQSGGPPETKRAQQPVEFPSSLVLGGNHAPTSPGSAEPSPTCRSRFLPTGRSAQEPYLEGAPARFAAAQKPR